jgi:type II secretory pathway pseudopilin PulG
MVVTDKKYMLMTELICAIALLGIISACFLTTITYMNKAQANFIRENRAILILDNTLERVKSFNHTSPEKIKIIFEDEYQKSSLNGNKKITPVCEILQNKTRLSFKDTRNRTVTEITIKHEN